MRHSCFRSGPPGRRAEMKSISVNGIADDADYLTAGSNVGLIVKKGNVAFKVAVYGKLPVENKRAMEKTLAQQIVSKLRCIGYHR